MSAHVEFDPVPQLAAELQLDARRISAVLRMLADGNTVPFIARYRKEATGELDEVQIRSVAERHAYLVELEQRRQTVLTSIAEQGRLTDELRRKILAADTKTGLEDLYLPYRPKRRTRATIARERGLSKLAERILAQADDGNPLAEARNFIAPEKGVGDEETALAGARDIAAEQVAEMAEVRAAVRRIFFERGQLVVEAAPGKRDQPTKYEQYYDRREPVAAIPSHRFLAIRRGEREGVLRGHVEVDADALIRRILGLVEHEERSPFGEHLHQAVSDAYVRLIAPSVENDVRAELKQRSDQAAVEVFASNLRNLLMAAPLGGKPVIGVDPGLRTGSKVAAVDATGKFLASTTLYLTRSAGEREKARQAMRELVRRHRPTAVAVGNGTGGRQTETFVRQALAGADGCEQTVVVQVNEAGASVYSASATAREELPDQDVTVRGAVSIARRLQDPLAELVKIDPKAIGVGQYQHDVHQPLLARHLDQVVESCVNQVGVELNTASAPLLSRVAGIGPKLARTIVDHRNEHGAFGSRGALHRVSGLGRRTFEQAAGFLRVRGGEHPLDASAVHPERYELVERIAADLGGTLSDLVDKPEAAERIDVHRYISDEVGAPTLRDIVSELKKPGRDPRSTFEPIRFRDGVHTVADLQVGMQLEGVVTNVTNFGAFVDVGVHRDGLVHISQLSDGYVRNPHQAVKVGDRLRVHVLEVDVERGRISLTTRGSQASKREQNERRGAAPMTASGISTRKRSAAAGEPHRVAGRAKDARQRTSESKGSPTQLTHNPFAEALKKR